MTRNSNSRGVTRSRLATATRLGAAIAGASVAAAGTVFAGALVEARFPVQRTAHVKLSQRSCFGLRILQISDTHLHPSSTWEIPWLQSLAQLEPDLVLLTGDNLSDKRGFPMLREALEPLRGTPGAFVFGSNDYYSPVFSSPLRYFRPLMRNLLGKPHGKQTSPAGTAGARPAASKRATPDLPHQQMADFLEDLGWVDLRNASANMCLRPLLAGSRQGIRVSLMGVDDPHINYDAEPCPGADWATADLRLGVTHAPYARVLDQMTALGSDLIIAGHTHGGQVCLPGGRALVNNTDIPLAYSGGLARWQLGAVSHPKPHVRQGVERPLSICQPAKRQASWVHVSRGLGTSKYAPFRLFCRPETNLIVVD